MQGSFSFCAGDFLLQQAGPGDGSLLEQIHKQAFSAAWDRLTFEQFLCDKQIFCYIICRKGIKCDSVGFICWRQILDEAEIISFAVVPAYQRRQLGYRLMDAALRRLYQERVRVLFLEVAEDNTAARGLYHGFGFKERGKRPHYYQTPHGRVDAVMMELEVYNNKMCQELRAGVVK